MSHITGHEPSISGSHDRKGQWRLSPKRLATMLNVLPPDAISLQAAEQMLLHEDFYVRFNAAKMLGKRGDRDARLIIEKMLNEGGVQTRASAARHLYGFTWYVAEPLIKQALTDDDPRVREAAVYALCDIGDENAYQLLTESLQDETDDVRGAAAFGLRDRQDAGAVPVLEAALGAEDPDIRSKVLETLGANATPQAAVVVKRALIEDPEPDVQYAAAQSLLELCEESALMDFPDILNAKSGADLQWSMRGYFHATNYLHLNVQESPALDDLVAAFERALLDGLSETRIQATFCLSWIRHPRATELLRDAYHQEKDIETKAQIMRVSSSLMAEVGDELLQDALKSEDDHLREVAETVQSILAITLQNVSGSDNPQP